MNYDKFTVKMQKALEAAIQTANENGHSEVVPAHMVLALQIGRASCRERV